MSFSKLTSGLPTSATAAKVAPKMLAIVAAAGLSLTATGAKAQDLSFSYGVDIVSDYISKGFTNSDNKPAIQPYLEIGYEQVYLSFWGSNASFGGVKDIELDVGVGWRPELEGPIGLDFGVVRYFYRDDKTDYGEAYMFASYDVSDRSSLAFRYYREIYSDYNTFVLRGSVSDLGWGLTASAELGSDFGSRGNKNDAVYGNIGLSKDLNDFSAVDLRAHQSSREGSEFTLMLSFFN